MTSTTSARPPARLRPRWGAARLLLVIAFWVGVWQVAAIAVGQQLLLAAPTEVLVRLSELVGTGAFWAAIGHSFARIATGFALAVVVGVLGAAAAARVRLVDILVTPLLAAVRATPVVSFIILVIMLAGSARLAVVISFLMVLPIIYTNVLAGIRNRDPALLEMATVFRVPLRRRVSAIDVPAVLPFLIAACEVGLGLAWKAGIAAEVIGLPRGSIGEQLYQAKIFFSSPDLFAWTVAIIALAFSFERLVLVALRRAEGALSRGRSS